MIAEADQKSTLRNSIPNRVFLRWPVANGMAFQEESTGLQQLARIVSPRQLMELYDNAADTVLEGVSKPESEFIFDAVTDPVRKIAHWVPVTDEMLEESARRAYRMAAGGTVRRDTRGDAAEQE